MHSSISTKIPILLEIQIILGQQYDTERICRYTVLPNSISGTQIKKA